MRRLFFISIIFLLAFHQTFACDCKMDVLTLDAIKNSELIFIGKVAAISGCDKTSHVSFAVEKLFRGKCFPETSLEFDCTSDCQMSFSPGETWIIYATYIEYGKAQVEFCSYSRRQIADESKDYYTSIHGMTFTNEVAWLTKNLGEQKLNEKDIQSEQHHENIRPQGYAVLYYLAGGFIGLMVIYYLSKKFLK